MTESIYDEAQRRLETEDCFERCAFYKDLHRAPCKKCGEPGEPHCDATGEQCHDEWMEEVRRRRKEHRKAKA